VTVVVRHDRSPHKTPGDGGALYDSTLGAPPCEGESCTAADCVPDPDDVDACEDERVPAAVLAKLDKARQLLARGTARSARAAAKLLGKAARRTARAAKSGDLERDCADDLGAALAGGRTCARCAADD
jgi:hypothetical protein